MFLIIIKHFDLAFLTNIIDKVCQKHLFSRILKKDFIHSFVLYEP